MSAMFLFISLGVIVIFLIFFIANKFEKKRIAFLENLALTRGLKFDKDARILTRLKDLEVKKEIIADYDKFAPEVKKKLISFKREEFLDYTNLQIFIRGYSKEARNLLIIPFKDNFVFLFDYFYTIGEDRNWNTSDKYKEEKNEHTIALIKLSSKLPDFYLRPENIADKISAKLGFDDIDIEQYPEFSKKYYLLGKNKDEILSFFTPERIAYLENNSGWTIYAKDNYLAFFKGVNRISANDYENYINEISIFLGSINVI